MVVADHQHIAPEGHVGLREGKQRGTITPFGVLVGLSARVLGLRRVGLPGLGQRQTGGVRGVEEAGGLAELGHKGEMVRRFSRVLEAGGKRHAGVGGKRAQEFAHALDLGLLLRLHVADELEEHGLVGAAGPLDQGVHHLERAVVMRDHEGQEQPVEVGAAERRELRHLFGRGHAGHRALHVHPAMHRRVGHGLAAFAQPGLHEADLVGLRSVDPARHRHQFRQVGAVLHQFGHLHGLVMVMDHVAHEGDVVRGVPRVGELHRLLGRELRGLLPRCARLHDGDVLQGEGARGQQHHGAGGEERGQSGPDAVVVHPVILPFSEGGRQGLVRPVRPRPPVSRSPPSVPAAIDAPGRHGAWGATTSRR